jgi:hypothetical protein
VLGCGQKELRPSSFYVINALMLHNFNRFSTKGTALPYRKRRIGPPAKSKMHPNKCQHGYAKSKTPEVEKNCAIGFNFTGRLQG